MRAPILLVLVACGPAARDVMPARGPAPVPALTPPAPRPAVPVRALPDGRARVAYVVKESELRETDCEIASNDGLQYEGALRIDGHPFAASDYVEQGSGTVFLYERTLEARVEWTGPTFDVDAELHLPELTLFPRVPVVFDRWIQVLSTRVATATSVRGGLLAPEIQLPSWIKPRRKFSEPELRTPCGAFRSTEADDPIAGASSGELATGTKFTLHRAPRGEPLADVKVPEDGSLTALVIGKQQGWAYLALSAGTRMRFYGWATNLEFDDGASSSAFGTVGKRGEPPETVLECAGVDVFVDTPTGPRLVMQQHSTPSILRGEPDAAGNWRLDLGVPATEPNALRPFVPKEYLPRCLVRAPEPSGTD